MKFLVNSYLLTITALFLGSMRCFGSIMMEEPGSGPANPARRQHLPGN